MLSCLEALLGVVNACLPVLKPIYNKLRGTAPKGGAEVNEILKSGTIPIFMRVSQMFTLASRKRKDSTNDGETLTENSTWYEERKREQGGKSDVEGGTGASVTTREISPPMTEKAEKLMGIKAQEIHVRRDVDVESVVSRYERGGGWEGRQEGW